MPKLRVLSGQDVLRIFNSFGFVVYAQKGQPREGAEVAHPRRAPVLDGPLHKEIDRGTLMAIYRQACRFIAEQELRDHFFR
jgi:predicted RNA binding protein YcfA (HicA-like mRNA interferase family)